MKNEATFLKTTTVGSDTVGIDLSLVTDTIDIDLSLVIHLLQVSSKKTE